MSLERFFNRDLLLTSNGPAIGQLFSQRDLDILDDVVLIPEDPNLLKDQRGEIHVYSFYGDYILGNHDAKYATLEKVTNSLLIDISATFKEAKINRGSYVIVSNLFQAVWGDFDNRKVIVTELSPDRTEIKLQIDKKYVDELGAFQSKVQSLKSLDVLNNLVINFGFNRVQKITNIRFVDNTIFVKLYEPLFDELSTKDSAWFDYEVIDPYIDTIILVSPIAVGNVSYLRGPNFDIDTSQYSSNATDFKSWDDLLDSNLATSQQIIDQSLSGSSARINVDYTDFNNFVYYSSAEERLKNMHYKVSKIEEYSSSIAILLSSTASITSFVSGSVDLNRRRIDQITTNFGPWERWLWYEPTSSIFSHDLSGSITPWPKRLVSGSWLQYPISSSIVTNWYNNLISSASDYDLDNMNRLYWAIPEHIYANDANSDYVLFLDMIGEHYDVLYSYTKALTQVHEKEEHPKRGVSNDLLYEIAKGFGWKLQNTRATSDLWLYKLGTNNQGVYAQTGSMFSLSEENQTHQVWRRIVNNLPYLLKTKGTSRSIKALMSIYGIPQTLISIKEYGGPSVSTDKPTLIEDRYYYSLKFSGSQYIEIPRRPIPPSSGSWGGIERPTDTIEFRFKTNYSSSVSMSMWAVHDGINRAAGSSDQCNINLELAHVRTKHPFSSSYSGSSNYGYLKLSALESDADGTLTLALKATSSLLPLYDNDFWTVQIYANKPVTGSNESESLRVRVAKASDSLYGRLSFTSSITLGRSFGLSYARSWGHYGDFRSAPSYTIIGGTTGSAGAFSGTGKSTRFIGEIHGYKEYFETISGSVFESHVLNPAGYQGSNETSSFYTLHKYFPLGLDQQRWDHGVYTIVSSSQPNRKASFDTTASFKGFTAYSESLQYPSDNEVFYIYTPTLGGNTLRSEKIRLEDVTLARDLSPVARSEVGAFDRAGFDSNRLAIVFAPSDQVNNDIFNHSGFFELDNWIGDPQSEYESNYSELKRYSNQYFQKYQRNYQINDFIKLLSIYDYTFFEQIKQLVPGRADLIAGILIESDVLNRSKVQITKRPTIEEPFYEEEIQGLSPELEGEYPVYETSASFAPMVTMAYSYLTGSIDRVVLISGSSLHHLGTGSRDFLGDTIDIVPTRYSGSQEVTQSYVDNYRLNCCYKKVIYHYSASGNFSTKYEKQWYAAVSKSYHMYYSRSLECTSYQYSEQCGAVENRARFAGSKLEGKGINIPSDQTIDGGPVVTIWEVNPNKLVVKDSPLGGGLTVE